MGTAASARRTWRAAASASECTATARRPIRRIVSMIRQAISPRLATRTVVNTGLARGGPDQHAHRRRIVRIARIVELRTVRDETQHVHLRAHLHVLAAGGDAVLERETPLRRHG